MLYSEMPKKKTTSKTMKPVRYAPGLGDRLEKARKRAGFVTQAALADAIGVRPLTINRIETGGQPPGKQTIEALVRVLEVPETWLLYAVGGEDALTTDAPDEVDAYLQSDLAGDISPDVARRLRSFPFWTLGITKPTLKDVNRVRELIEVSRATAQISRDGSTD